MLSLLVLIAISEATAQRLPLKSYTTAEGLAHNNVNRIVSDSHGFLWFCTADGLSRFDGYEFMNYGPADGLPHAVVFDLLQSREGEYWVATSAGLFKFNPSGAPSSTLADAKQSGGATEPMFALLNSEASDRYSKVITRLLEAHDGTIWVGTANGLFYLNRQTKTMTPVDIGLATDNVEQRYINALLEDRMGYLWVGTPNGLYRRAADGSAKRFSKKDNLSDDNIHDLLEDHRGNLWVATRFGGLTELANEPQAASLVVKRVLNSKNGLITNWVFEIFESSDHKLWAGTNAGLAELAASAENAYEVQHIYTKRNGFSYHEIANIAEDRDGNLWLGTINGAMKLARGGLVTFGERDGICCVNSVFTSSDGRLYVIGNVLGDKQGNVVSEGNVNLASPESTYWRRVGVFDGQRFTWTIPDILKNKPPGWSNRIVLRTRDGEWWIGVSDGLYHFPRLSSFSELRSALPKPKYTTKDALATLDVFSIYEDSRGDVWISTSGSNGNGLARWEHASARLQDMAQAAGLPSLKEKLPTAFAEDSQRNLWIGFNQGELARYQGGRFTVFTTADGLPAGRVDDLYLDHAGRLWVAMRRELVRVDNPSTEHPHFVDYTTAQGLSSNYVTTVTEDRFGRIYVGTSQGLDCLDPTSGRVQHYTTADGLAAGEIVDMAVDRDGSIWVATSTGLSRLQPESAQSLEAPPILIKGLNVAGTSRQISAIGETEVALRDLSSNENQIQVDFVGLSFAPGELLRYQYRLEGAAGDWTAPSTQRTVNFANLAPGHYRFLVRAVTADGIASQRPATISFTILRPIWQRWWFLTVAATMAVLIIYSLYRYRMSNLIELVRIRTRIASDLHDDIGAGLSRLAILSEVARHEAGGAAVSERLGEIAQGSRQLVDSMSDIVWVINPKRDQLRDLVQRMRRFASDLFTASAIEFTFHVADELDVKVGADVRRQLFLIFKEATNNVARHSACTKADIELTIADGIFTFTIKDNGRGFDPAKAFEGNGLVNMRERARLLKAELSIDSHPGTGTSVTLETPLKANVQERNGRLRGFPST